MKLSIQDGELIAAQLSTEQYAVIRSWNLMRWDKSRQAMKGKTSIDLLNRFELFGKLPPDIEALRLKLESRQQRIEQERKNDNPVPLTTYPVRVPLFKHQIKGANMALLTFGWNPEKGGFDNEETKEVMQHAANNGKGFAVLAEMGCG